MDSVYYLIRSFRNIRKEVAKVNVIPLLVELQDVDGQLRELDMEMKDIPARKAQENSRLDGARLALAEAKAHLVDAQLAEKKCETEAEEARAKIRELRISQSSNKMGNNEYRDISIRCDQLQQEAEAADNRGQALMEEKIPLEEAVKKAQARLDEESVGVNAYIKELDERLAEVTAEHGRLEAERKECAAKIPQDVLAKYDRLRSRRWPVLVLLTEDEVCDGCHMKQPPAVAQAVRHNSGLVGCSECGRILYRDI